MPEEARTLIRTLVLPYENVRTVYEGDSEVRLYRNELTGELQVGKRFDVLGLEESEVVEEGAHLRQIQHPHITPVYDVARVEGYPEPMKVVEIIMPYYERGSLYDAFQRSETFSVGQAVALAEHALYGLAELHEVQGLLHRDVKSPNLLLANDGRLVVSDLGVAIAMDADGGAEALPNARLYTPPESLTSHRVDRRSDLYQVGVVLHELASGPLPYTDPAYDIVELAERLAQGRRGILPRHLNQQPWVPRRLRTVINKATARDPASRYPTAKAMVDALAAVRLVDWQFTVDEPDHRRWEGATPQRPDRRFAVDAAFIAPSARRRNRGWRLSGLQRVTAWQRVVPDALIPELAGSQAAGFFDAMVDIACSR